MEGIRNAVPVQNQWVTESVLLNLISILLIFQTLYYKILIKFLLFGKLASLL